MTQEELTRYEDVLKILFQIEEEMAAIKARLKELEERDNA